MALNLGSHIRQKVMLLFNTKWNSNIQHFQMVYTVGVILEMCSVHNIEDTLKRHMCPERWPCDTQEGIVLCPNQGLIQQVLTSWPPIMFCLTTYSREFHLIFTVPFVASTPGAVCWSIHSVRPLFINITQLIIMPIWFLDYHVLI